MPLDYGMTVDEYRNSVERATPGSAAVQRCVEFGATDAGAFTSLPTPRDAM